MRKKSNKGVLYEFIEFQQEQKRVDSVMKTISEQISKLEEETNQRRDEVVHIRKHFWDEVKVNTDTFDDSLRPSSA